MGQNYIKKMYDKNHKDIKSMFHEDIVSTLYRKYIKM